MNAPADLNRVILIVFDSVGCGELPDARDYGDVGSDTLGNISRRIPLAVPNLRRLGLARVSTVSRRPDEPEPIG
ncbi:MAG: phosphopentomutase, partial [Acidobacteria bacterium]|nr:phosphopentomutase [Acidobacteriota bacterium]